MDSAVDLLLQAARAAIEGGERFPVQFLIPTNGRRWRIICHDLVAAGENDLGIPPKAFAYGAVGMLAASMGARLCYVAETATVATAAGPTPAPAPAPGEDPGSRQAVVVTVFAQGRLDIHMQPYGRDDDGTIVWAEPTQASTPEPGPLGSAVPLWRAVNREPAPLPPPEGLIEDMTDSGFIIVAED